MQVFKAGVSDVGFKPFALQGEVQGLQVVSSIPILAGCAEGGAYGQTVSQPLLFILMWVFFLVCLMHRSCLSILEVCFRGNCSLCTLVSVD